MSTFFTTESGNRIEARLVAQLERPDLGWQRPAEILVGEENGKKVFSLRLPTMCGSMTCRGPKGLRTALRKLQRLILEVQPPIKFGGSLAEYLNRPRTALRVEYHHEIRWYGRPVPTYSQATQKSYGERKFKLYFPCSRDEALGYGCATVPTECATDGTSWAVMRNQQWYDTTAEELKKELRLTELP